MRESMESCDRPDVVDHAPEAVANHAANAFFPAQGAVHGEFHAFLAVVFGVGEAHDVREHGTVGIKAAHFGRDADAGNAELSHGFRGRDALAAREIDEVRRGRMLKLAAKRRVRHTERLGERLQVLLVGLEREGGVGPDVAHRQARSEDDAVAVQNLAARTRERHRAGVAVFPLALQKVRVEDLQIEGAHGQAQKARHDEEERHVGAGGRDAHDDERTALVARTRLSSLAVTREKREEKAADARKDLHRFASFRSASAGASDFFASAPSRITVCAPSTGTSPKAAAESEMRLGSDARRTRMRSSA